MNRFCGLYVRAFGFMYEQSFDIEKKYFRVRPRSDSFRLDCKWGLKNLLFSWIKVKISQKKGSQNVPIRIISRVCSNIMTIWELATYLMSLAALATLHIWCTWISIKFCIDWKKLYPLKISRRCLFNFWTRPNMGPNINGYDDQVLIRKWYISIK